MNIWQKVKLKVITSLNRIRINFNIEKTPKFYRIVIHEKLKPAFKWLKIVLTAIGLLAAFYTFENSLYSFLFGFSVWALITFIEKTIFIFNSLVVLPLLTYEHEPERLLGASFGYAVPKAETIEVPVVGFVVKDEEYARQLHETLIYWTGGETRDEKCNICLSAIVLNANEYVFLCYPNIENESVKIFHKKVEAKRKETSLTDTHIPLFALTILGKRCQIGAGSYFPTFRKRHQDGTPVLFQICMPDKNGQVKSIEGISDFIVFNLKIRDREELTRKDIEYDFLRVMG